MALEFKMPQLGESVVEGTIGKWLKEVGEPVREFEPLLEVATDKVDTEIPSPVSGVLQEIRAAEGTTVRVGQVIAVLAEGAAAEGPQPAPGGAAHPGPAQPAAASPPRAGPPAAGEAPPQGAGERPAGPSVAGETAPLAAGQRPAGRGYLTPVVAKIAAEHNVDLAQVQGTGRHGRITKVDILRHLEQPQAAPAVPAAAAPAPLPQPPGPPPPAAPAGPGAGDVEVPLTKMRQAIVRHMRQAKDTAAHVTTFMEADLSRVVAYRKSHQAEFAAEGIKLTYTPFFVEAIVAGLKAYPMLNAVLAEDRLIYRRAIHIGLAVDLGEEGLIVPVVKHADGKNLRGLCRAVNDLTERARSRKLAPDDVQGATFTLTNHGVTGSLAGTPIIPMPQVGILGVGAIQKRPIVIETEAGDSLAIRPMSYLSLSFDHRVIDGATADRFLGVVVAWLERYGA